MTRIFFETLKKEVKKISEDHGETLEILYYTGRDLSPEYVSISNTPIYGEERFFITVSIDMYSTCNTKVASVTIPRSFGGYQEAVKIYERLKLLDVRIFTPPDGEYNPMKWMRPTYPYDQGLIETIFPGLDSEE